MKKSEFEKISFETNLRPHWRTKFSNLRPIWNPVMVLKRDLESAVALKLPTLNCQIRKNGQKVKKRLKLEPGTKSDNWKFNIPVYFSEGFASEFLRLLIRVLVVFCCYIFLQILDFEGKCEYLFLWNSCLTVFS